MGDTVMKEQAISRATLSRVPVYLKYLKNEAKAEQNISATKIARDLCLGEVQVRKDLGVLCGEGRPKIGYKTSELLSCLERYFDLTNIRAVIVGSGNFALSLLDFRGFEDCGLEIPAAFDGCFNERKHSEGGKQLLPLREMKSYIEKNGVKIGIICCASENAQKSFDLLYKSGIRAMWCISPCRVSAPSDAVVEYENPVLTPAYLRCMTEPIKVQSGDTV